MKQSFFFSSFGADPEFFLVDREGNLRASYEVMSSQNIMLNNCQIYPDNVLGEASFDASFTLPDFRIALKTVVDDIQRWAKARGLKAIFETAGLYEKDQLCDIRAHAIGCEPFYSAYNPGQRFTPTAYTSGWRYAGGHIHLGYDRNLIPEHVVIKEVDEVLYDLYPEFRNEGRDHFYGMRGAYRSKPYGAEYRSISAHWLSSSEKIDEVVSLLKTVEDNINDKYF